MLVNKLIHLLNWKHYQIINKTMKQILSTLVLVIFMAGASFASFPVNKSSNSNESTAVEANEIDSEKSEIAVEKKSKLEKKIDKLAAKIQKKVSPAAEGGDKDMTVAIILALVSVIILPIGLHNWYLGRNKQALWQTILFLLIITSPISWIWQIVDLIRLLVNGSLP
ncbi:MAG: TM2 domain-containing protein [Arenibacter sp.]